MRKVLIWFKLNWQKILAITVALAIVILGVLFIRYCINQFTHLETFSKRSIAGQMALLLPMFILVQIAILPFFFAMNYYLMFGGGLGKLKKKSMNKEVNVKWSEVIGMEEAKKDAWEIVKLLKDRNLVRAIGGNIIKGTLMIGPPGCGKTYLAKAMATECGLPMISAVGSEFVAMFMGQGAARMKSLFKQAREMAKIHGGCIIFIDEIDAFARPREEQQGFGRGGSASVSHNATINQFLTEMDGLKKTENNIVVIAATNVNEEELDPAIMRSGRFDRKIRVEKPNAKEREDLTRFYLSRVDADGSIDVPKLADQAKWFSPSDISNMVREAGVIALRENRTKITPVDLETALKRVMISIEKTGGDKILSSKVNVKWDEVIGMADAKEEAWEMVKLLKDRNLLKSIGGKIVKGVLMLGPPGCGKTYLAKAMATESGFPFISAVGSDLVGIFVGEGAAKMKSIFVEARKLARAEGGCIVFFDEIDSFARPRMTDRGFGGTISHNATINQFLTELDGLRQEENNIVVLAATNAAESDLDPAILRAGRIERKIHVSLPTVEDRKELFKFYFSKVQTGNDVEATKWANIAVGITPADIDNIVREAGLIALRDKREVIMHKDLMLAYDRITIGAVSREKYTKKSLLKTSYHESGHAIMTYLVHPTNEVIKATIKPRKGALGYIWDRPIEELRDNSPNKEHWLAEIQVLLAGYVAERIAVGTTASGVGGGPGSDFHRATKIATFMVWSLGMGSSGLIGDFTAIEAAQVSEKTRETLDQDAQEILQTCLKKTTETLTENKEVLEYFAQELLEKGDLEYNDVQAIFDRFSLKPATKAA